MSLIRVIHNLFLLVDFFGDIGHERATKENGRLIDVVVLIAAKY
jgi:hypothetical protein